MKLNAKAEHIMLNQKPRTHMVVVAHQDDIEIICPNGIVECYADDNKGLLSVVVTDGGNSPRAGRFADFTYDQMVAARRLEQIEASKIGNHAELFLLNYTSGEVKDKTNTAPADDLYEILMENRPEVLYTHNLADKHPTHVGVAVKLIEAVRRMPKELRPKKFIGLEGWRSLDWLSDNEKLTFDISGYNELLRKALAAHVSQCEGGKTYDIAVEGRRIGHATFSQSHSVDEATSLALGMDLMPLLIDDNLDPKEFILSKIDLFKSEILV